jgi:D-glycero-beta-D-manno-heptose-7-phosphate kinase
MVTRGVSRERLLALVSSFQARRLVVAGDYVLDRFIYGHPKRVSREAPVLILRFWKEESLPGGAGNTAANVGSLGGVPVPVGAVGDDDWGRTLIRILRERGVDTTHILTVPGYTTPTKTRILGGGPHSIKQQIVRYDREDQLPKSDDIRGAIQRHLREAGSGAQGAILSDYGYGSVWAGAPGTLRPALAARAPMLVDSRHGLSGFAGVDAVTPNEEELEEVAGQPFGDSVDALGAAAESLMNAIHCPIVLVTRGSRGMALFERGGETPTLIPVHGTDQVADVTGAGDTVLATFSLALASEATPLEAAHLANFAGGVVVMKMGTAVVTPDELREAIASDRAILP